MCNSLIFTILVTMARRKQKKYEIESERKIIEAAQKQKQTNEKIYKEFIKNEDAI